MIWLEQFVAVLPSEAQTWVMKHSPQTLEEAVSVMESFEAAERMSGGRGYGGAIRKEDGPEINHCSLKR